MDEPTNRRILIVDDQESVRADFKKILVPRTDSGLAAARAAFFGVADEAAPQAPQQASYELTMASQGDEGLVLLAAAVARDEPFALAFIDIRMPPGPDGLATISGLWASDPDVQVVICTAYSDYSFEEIIGQLGASDRLLILKKPFDPVEVRQLAGAMTAKWNVQRRDRAHMAELREANARAQAASRAKSEFLANMSHEIRTPMNAILGYVDMLGDSNVSPDEAARYREIIGRSGDHLLTILNDILDLSCVEAGRMVTSEVEFSPIEQAKEVANLLLTQACEKDLQLTIRAETKLPRTIVSDPVRVRQVLLNLVGNAIKFTPKGSVCIVLRFERDSDGGHLCFDVVDTGPGIAPEYLPNLFHVFDQMDTSLTRRAGGTGLGLSISMRLARILRGEVRVESELGKGSKFTFRIRLEQVDEQSLVHHPAPDLRLPVQAKVSVGRISAEFHGRVLLVEDVRVNQVLIAAMLERAGAEVVLADHGEHAIARVAQAQAAGEDFDLILMDMQMPVMDGYEACGRLRAAGFQAPILALTAHAMAGDRDRCLEAGCTEYITKPLDRGALLTLCRQLTYDSTGRPRRAAG